MLRQLGAPFNPLTGRYRVPDERTLRQVYARVDAAALAAVGFAQLNQLAGQVAAESSPPGPRTPDGLAEREQRRAHRGTGTSIEMGAVWPRRVGGWPTPWTANACAAPAAGW